MRGEIVWGNFLKSILLSEILWSNGKIFTLTQLLLKNMTFIFSFVFTRLLAYQWNDYCHSGNSTAEAREGVREYTQEKWAKLGREQPGVSPSFTLNSRTHY